MQFHFKKRKRRGGQINLERRRVKSLVHRFKYAPTLRGLCPEKTARNGRCLQRLLPRSLLRNCVASRLRTSDAEVTDWAQTRSNVLYLITRPGRGV